MSDNKDISIHLKDIFNVLELADQGTGVLSVSFAKDFAEEDPAQILSSYANYIEENPIAADESEKWTTMHDKITEGSYTSFYQVFQDTKVASSSLIKESRVGSITYNKIDFFYKFTTELLLRESSRLKVKLFVERKDKDAESKSKSNGKDSSKQDEVKEEEDDNEEDDEEEEVDDDETNFEAQISEDFDKISSTYSAENGEVIYVIHKIDDPSSIPPVNSLYPHQQEEPPKQKNQPLFTSLTGKSSVDPRPTLIPNPYQLSQIVPHNRSSSRETSSIGFLSPASQKFPPPTSQPTEMMSNFFHPNWYTLAVPSWLEYQTIRARTSTSTSFTSKKESIQVSKALDSYVNSFAPSSDSRSSIITQDYKANIWLQHIGLKEIEEIRKAHIKNKEGVEASEEEESKDIEMVDSDEKESEGENKELNGKVSPADEGEKSQEDGSENKEEISNGDVTAEDQEPLKINFDNLIKWDPVKIDAFEDFKNEKETITKSPQDFQRLISKHLVSLNKLRQERYNEAQTSSTLPSIPSSIEVKLYQKTVKLITLFLEHNKVAPSDLSLHFSRRLPVLLKEYSGTLPGSVVPSKTVTSTYTKNPRLPSIRGPYKKKNRL